MSLWILDTDHVSLFQTRYLPVVERVTRVNPKDIAVTIVTAEEQLTGWLSVINKASRPTHSAKLVPAYTGLLKTLNYFRSIRILSFDNAAHNCYEKLRSQNKRLGTKDLRIAAIVLSVNGILVTRNQRDFSQVPSLVLEDWTIP